VNLRHLQEILPIVEGRGNPSRHRQALRRRWVLAVVACLAEAVAGRKVYVVRVVPVLGADVRPKGDHLTLSLRNLHVIVARR
jgi:hypothetical protein